LNGKKKINLRTGEMGECFPHESDEKQTPVPTQPPPLKNNTKTATVGLDDVQSDNRLKGN